MGFFDRLADTIAGDDVLPPGAREELALARALADRGDLAEAEARLEDLTRSHAKLPAAFAALGEVRARRGDDEGAVAAFGRAIDLSRAEVAGWLGLGEALARLGRADPARDALRRVLSMTGDPALRARAHAARGRLAARERAFGRAVRELRKAAELAPEDLAVAAELGRALVAASDPEGPSWLVRAAQDREAPAALVVEAALAAPDAPVGEGLLRRALAARESAGAEAAALAPLRAALARRLAAKDELDEARALARAAVAAALTDPEALAALREVEARAGNYDEALAAARREAELGRPPAAEALVPLALGRGTPDALNDLVAALPPAHPLVPALRAVAQGNAREDDLVQLAPLAPGSAGRRALAQGLSPGVPPRENLYGLLTYAHALAARTPEFGSLLPAAARALEAFDRPLLIAVMGEFNAGKSSFVNAICGEPVAPVGVTPTTATINVLRFGPPGGRVLYHDGRSQDLAADEVAGFLSRIADAEAAAVRSVEIFFPLDVLRRVEIVDTPGLNSLRPEHEEVARGFLVEADAIVWLFAVGQAAKATERDALSLAHAAGKRVLGVLSKADQASAEEIAAITTHVVSSLGDRIEALIPLSARQALEAERAGDEAALAQSGLPAVLAALEDRFFSTARALKRRTALGALDRFVRDGHAAIGPGAAAEAGPALGARRGLLTQSEAAVLGALAAERVALRARMEAGFRQAASELLELLRPRAWPFGERRVEAADEEILFDMLEDAVVAATARSRAALAAAAEGGPLLPIDDAVDRFRAYARGALSGGLVERVLREELPLAGSRLEAAALQRALVRRVPDAEAELFRPLAVAIARAYGAERRAVDEEEARAELRSLVRAERLERPLEALAAALAGLDVKSEPRAS